ncbi:transcriptional regulator [Arachidicoccus ginsenosidimutans]|uniref:BlaI/MecI/CopY family transcriptional regulator n=1 Tax=Arachidicoccus sp. BS20 TaxID=1850526 RepID=UPI0007F0CDEF|nr:BlaI/MecI/CopY family transcriptional regulator [Arachidicoccus sp. BS20]ANI90252.1 transcriptional regulator [Arachidicoccus sp. BS20]
MKTLTRAEEQIMKAVWDVNQGFLKDIIDALPEPKPHTNTVATILKILIEKEFVSYEVFSRAHRYYPLVSREEYSKGSLNNFVSNYFKGSYKEAVSFLVKEKELSVKDLELLLKQLKKK